MAFHSLNVFQSSPPRITGTHFSLFGQLVIITLIQIGGLGFMMMVTLVAMAWPLKNESG